MRYLRTHESIESVKDWVDEVMTNCKDIMLELQDAGMEINVKRSLYAGDRVLVVDCVMSHPSAFRWSRYGVIDVYNRLADYMKSEGFEELSRRIGNVDNFPKVNGKYQGEISFKKSDMDSDYIGHLRYLKKYNQE
jgi:hypothetical protein